MDINTVIERQSEELEEFVNTLNSDVDEDIRQQIDEEIGNSDKGNEYQ